jgi:hypothetical protein
MGRAVVGNELQRIWDDKRYRATLKCNNIQWRRVVRFETFSFGSLQIDGDVYDHDVVIDGGKVRKRKKKPSKKFREQYGHTPLSAEEEIPWSCRRLVVGTGAYGRLPVMDDVKLEAERRKVELVLLPTTEAIEALKRATKNTNAILHVTC